jgi:hypothetical protein
MVELSKLASACSISGRVGVSRSHFADDYCGSKAELKFQTTTPALAGFVV